MTIKPVGSHDSFPELCFCATEHKMVDIWNIYNDVHVPWSYRTGMLHKEWTIELIASECIRSI